MFYRIELARTFDSAEAILSGFPQLKTEETYRGQGGSATSREVIMATVLVVDDEFGIVDVLETILTDEGYRVSHRVQRQAGPGEVGGAKNPTWFCWTA